MIARMLDRYILACLSLDMLCILATLTLAEYLRTALPFGLQLEDRGYLNWVVYLLALVLWLVSAFHFRLYEWRWTVTWRGELARITAASAGFALLFAATLYLSFRDVPRLLFLYYAPLAAMTILATHVIVRQVTIALPSPQLAVRVVVVGTGRMAVVLATRIAQRPHPWPPVTIVGFISTAGGEEKGHETLPFPILGDIEHFADTIQTHQITTVLLSLPPAEHATTLRVNEESAQLAIDVRLLPDVLALASARATIEYVEGLPLLGLRDPALTLPSRIVKYTFDRIVSAAGLVATAPLLLLIAIAIKLDSPGPILYRARRIGEGGQLFEMLKFRTMHVGADRELATAIDPEALQRGIFKVKGDPRVTRLGRLLRRASLDEVPQLINVLRGEMSLVGPRPEQPFIAAQYESWQHKRTELRPGLTGWWQVNGRSDKPLHQNTDFDIYYLENYSFWLDLRIIGRTIGAVLRGRGAY